ncbi:hypothetical protein PsorP6_002648 [Peronosclerospora sorghi]|uniref:Uncharacterized protein n=1 Tax=Peronosclerospora sorghi TaxID=230839 RepID=A0ACC0WXG6_9STRA|nr:hypothetical protein PsorP6_002648 [Peronosclerospora sorghi]
MIKTEADLHDRESRQFHSVFVASGASRSATSSMGKFVAIDGTLTKNRFILVLLLAVEIDAEDQLIFLAWAFITHQLNQKIVLSLTIGKSVLLLKNLLLHSMPFAASTLRGMCKQDSAAKKLFWKCAYAGTEAVFQECIAELRVLKAEAAEYVMEIEHDECATYDMPALRLGHCASKLAEIANSFRRKIRKRNFLKRSTGIKWRSFSEYI